MSNMLEYYEINYRSVYGVQDKEDPSKERQMIKLIIN